MEKTLTPKPHILVLEANKEIREFTRKSVLEPNGYQVTLVEDGPTGLEAARGLNPDLILLDYDLPTMNGLEFLRALRDQNIHIPVILLKTYTSRLIDADIFNLGVLACVLKPFKMATLAKAVQDAMSALHLEEERDALLAQLKYTTAQLKQTTQESSRQVQELNTLYRVSKAVTTLREREKLMERIVDAALYLTGAMDGQLILIETSCLLYTSPSPRDRTRSRMPSSA